MLDVSVIIPTHNPNPERLHRTLLGLKQQTFHPFRWDVLIVDNASATPLGRPDFTRSGLDNVRVLREPQLGLTHARRSGFTASHGRLLVLADDDNVLAPDYLENVVRLFDANPKIGALGGRSLPEFEQTPPAWMREFDGLIACRDLGPAAKISNGLKPAGAIRHVYPEFAPIGAGMALRRDAIKPWLHGSTAAKLSDRRGTELTSGGDNDIVLTLMENGWEVGYFPELSLVHLIPAGRIEPDYLARLNRGIAKSWMEVLSLHDANPWPRIAAWTIPVRQLKSWFSNRAWSGPSNYIRWQGACGHFEGRR